MFSEFISFIRRRGGLRTFLIGGPLPTPPLNRPKMYTGNPGSIESRKSLPC